MGSIARATIPSSVFGGIKDTDRYLVAVELEHEKCHKQQAFSGNFTVELSGTTLVDTIIEAGDKPVHLKEMSVSANVNDIYCALYTGGEYTKGAVRTFSYAGLGPYNAEFVNTFCGSENVTSAGIYLTSAVVDLGKMQCIGQVPGGTGVGQSVSGGASATGWEVIIKPNQKALLRTKRGAGTGAGVVVYRLKMYEV